VNQHGGINAGRFNSSHMTTNRMCPPSLRTLNQTHPARQKVFATIGPFVQFGHEARQVAEQNKVPMVEMGLPPSMNSKAPNISGGHDCCRPSEQEIPSTRPSRPTAGRTCSLWPTFSTSTRTPHPCRPGRLAGGYKFTKMPDTFGFDQQDFQPILNKMMDQINTLKPDAIILYVNPIAFPVIYKVSAASTSRCPSGRHGLRAPAIFAQGPQRSRGVHHELRGHPQPTNAAR